MGLYLTIGPVAEPLAESFPSGHESADTPLVARSARKRDVSFDVDL